MQVYDLAGNCDMSCGGMPVRSILVRNLWTSIEYNWLDFELLVPCAMVFSLLNDYCLVMLRVKHVLKAVFSKGFNLGILPSPSFLPSDLDDCD